MQYRIKRLEGDVQNSEKIYQDNLEKKAESEKLVAAREAQFEAAVC